jgi:hypothetical protein
MNDNLLQGLIDRAEDIIERRRQRKRGVGKITINELRSLKKLVKEREKVKTIVLKTEVPLKLRVKVGWSDGECYTGSWVEDGREILLSCEKVALNNDRVKDAVRKGEKKDKELDNMVKKLSQKYNIDIYDIWDDVYGRNRNNNDW